VVCDRVSCGYDVVNVLENVRRWFHFDFAPVEGNGTGAGDGLTRRLTMWVPVQRGAHGQGQQCGGDYGSDEDARALWTV